MGNVKKIHSQRFQRNGVSGDAAVVTAFTSSEGEYLIAVSLTPHLNSDLTPIAHYGGETATQERFIDRWVSAFCVRTVVVDPADPTSAFRGADYFAPEIAQAWRALCQSGKAHGSDQTGYDPATEWYDELHFDPAELARLKAENRAAIEETFGLRKGVLS